MYDLPQLCIYQSQLQTFIFHFNILVLWSGGGRKILGEGRVVMCLCNWYFKKCD